MAFISPKVVSVENQISGGKPTGELREHFLVSREEATTPALKWMLLSLYGEVEPRLERVRAGEESCIFICSDSVHTLGNHI